MHKNFLRTLLILATILMTTVTADAVQRFVLDTSDIEEYETTKGGKLHKFTPGTLEWNGLRLDPIQSYNNPHVLEWICAQGERKGPELLRGQRVTLSYGYDYTNTAWREGDCTSKFCTVFGAIICCPIMVPIMLTCSSPNKEYSNTRFTTSLGQINFNTEQQPKTVRLQFDKKDPANLVISPENTTSQF